MKKQTTLQVERLVFGNTNAEGVSVSEFDYEAFEIVLPPVTFEVIQDQDYSNEFLPKDATRKAWDAMEEEEREEIIEKFTNSRLYDEWRDGFAPMMLYYWPLFMHGKNPQAVAALIDEFAPNATLLEINGEELREMVGEDYAIVLNGGGMNLTDHLALAYICAGSVPPTQLLTGLSGVISSDKVKRCKKALQMAFAQSKAALESEIESLTRTQKEIFKRGKK